MFYTNFENMCVTRGTNPSAVVQKIGRPKSAASNWKKFGTLPKEYELIEMADVLECAVADFFRDDEERLDPIGAYERAFASARARESLEHYARSIGLASYSDDLDENERDILDVYKACTKRQRAKLLYIVLDFAETEQVR